MNKEEIEKRPKPDLTNIRSRVSEWTTKMWRSYGKAVTAARQLGGKRVSVRKLAQKLKLSFSTLSYLERGRPVYRRTLAVVERWLKERIRPR